MTDETTMRSVENSQARQEATRTGENPGHTLLKLEKTVTRLLELLRATTPVELPLDQEQRDTVLRQAAEHVLKVAYNLDQVVALIKDGAKVGGPVAERVHNLRNKGALKNLLVQLDELASAAYEVIMNSAPTTGREVSRTQPSQATQTESKPGLLKHIKNQPMLAKRVATGAVGALGALIAQPLAAQARPADVPSGDTNHTYTFPERVGAMTEETQARLNQAMAELDALLVTFPEDIATLLAVQEGRAEATLDGLGENLRGMVEEGVENLSLYNRLDKAFLGRQLITNLTSDSSTDISQDPTEESLPPLDPTPTSVSVAMANNNSAEVNTGSQSESATVIGTIQLNQSGGNLREEAGTYSRSLGTLPGNTTVEVLRVVTVSAENSVNNNATWYEVLFNGQVGYISDTITNHDLQLQTTENPLLNGDNPYNDYQPTGSAATLVGLNFETYLENVLGDQGITPESQGDITFTRINENVVDVSFRLNDSFQGELRTGLPGYSEGAPIDPLLSLLLFTDNEGQSVFSKFDLHLVVSNGPDNQTILTYYAQLREGYTAQGGNRVEPGLLIMITENQSFSFIFPEIQSGESVPAPTPIIFDDKLRTALEQNLQPEMMNFFSGLEEGQILLGRVNEQGHLVHLVFNDTNVPAGEAPQLVEMVFRQPVDFSSSIESNNTVVTAVPIEVTPVRAPRPTLGTGTEVAPGTTGTERPEAAPTAVPGAIAASTPEHIKNDPTWSYNPDVLAYEQVTPEGQVVRYYDGMGSNPEAGYMHETARFSGENWEIIINMNDLHPQYRALVLGDHVSSPEAMEIIRRNIEEAFPQLTEGPFFRLVVNISDQDVSSVRQDSAIDPALAVEPYVLDQYSLGTRRVGENQHIATLSLNRDKTFRNIAIQTMFNAIYDAIHGPRALSNAMTSQEGALTTEFAHIQLYERMAMELANAGFVSDVDGYTSSTPLVGISR